MCEVKQSSIIINKELVDFPGYGQERKLTRKNCILMCLCIYIYLYIRQNILVQTNATSQELKCNIMVMTIDLLNKLFGF